MDLGSLAVGLDSIYGQGDSLVLVSNGGLDTAYVNLGASTDTDDQTLLSNDTYTLPTELCCAKRM
ncbi:MAG: hypothetical protein H6579_03750 [Chitinophagales bacterium]|nr:hypothetical protein [Chitinophagales bacterium]